MATADIVRRQYARSGRESAFEANHCRSRAATLELGALARLRGGERVLDVGCGLGQPARDLATTFAVQVTGLDVRGECVARARQITARAGLADSVSFERGNALSAPFPTDVFDVVWLQHVLPNVPLKARLFDEARRVLAAKGRVAMHEVVAFDSGRLRFPLPWATTPATSFVARPERLQQSLEAAGFTVTDWRDTSQVALEWCRQLTPSAQQFHAFTNLADNIEAGRLGIVMAVFERTDWRPARGANGRVLRFTRAGASSKRRDL